MSVKLKIVPQSDWDVLKKYLNAEGVVLVPEENVKGIERLKQHGLENNEEISYDFGGDANVWVDIAYHEESYPINDLCGSAEVEEEEE